MQYYYGDKMPLRILDEAEFWKHQEKEHTVVIRQIASNLEREYIENLKKWEESFAKTKGRVVSLIEAVNRARGNISPEIYQEIMQMISFSSHQSKKFIKFLHTLKIESKAVKDNFITITVINHIKRESEYYVGVTKAILQG